MMTALVHTLANVPVVMEVAFINRAADNMAQTTRTMTVTMITMAVVAVAVAVMAEAVEMAVAVEVVEVAEAATPVHSLTTSIPGVNALGTLKVPIIALDSIWTQLGMPAVTAITITTATVTATVLVVETEPKTPMSMVMARQLLPTPTTISVLLAVMSIGLIRWTLLNECRRSCPRFMTTKRIWRRRTKRSWLKRPVTMKTRTSPTRMHPRWNCLHLFLLN